MQFNLVFGIVIGFLFVCLLILFCVLMVKLYIRKINDYNQLIYQKDIDFQKTLKTTVLESQELLLQDLSQDLHDDAGQQLTAINFQLEHLKLDDPAMQDALAPISEYVKQLSQSIRGISHSLNNQLAMKEDVLKAIANEITRFQKSKSITFELSITQPEHKSFTTDENVVIYRIFQEIINNVIKHAKATSVAIEIKTRPQFEMTVQDNGIGFNTEDKSNSLGMWSMKSRAGIINYDLEVQSQPNKGTTIILTEKQHL